jgi:hypothetical protein
MMTWVLLLLLRLRLMLNLLQWCFSRLLVNRGPRLATSATVMAVGVVAVVLMVSWEIPKEIPKATLFSAVLCFEHQPFSTLLPTLR